jgi:hypothetical protein
MGWLYVARANMTQGPNRLIEDERVTIVLCKIIKKLGVIKHLAMVLPVPPCLGYDMNINAAVPAEIVYILPTLRLIQYVFGRAEIRHDVEILMPIE